MPVSKPLYDKAKELSTTLVPKLRIVSIFDTLMPDDYNIPLSILQQYLQSVNQPFSALRLSVAMHDNTYGIDVEDLKKNAYNLWNYMNTSLGDPYSSDPDFQSLKSILDSIPFLFFGSLLHEKEWNMIFEFCRKITSVILKYPLAVVFWQTFHHDFKRTGYKPESYSTIYVGSWDTYLYAINPDGTLKWKFKTDGIVSSPTVSIGGTIYVGSFDYYLYAINPDGTQKWKFPTRDMIWSSPALA